MAHKETAYELAIFAVDLEPMSHTQFIPKHSYQITSEGKVTWQSPSNIALIKYWGKHGEQLPMNPSISFTLSECHTTSSLHYSYKDSPGFDVEVLLDGRKEDSFKPKILQFFERVEEYLPFLRDYSFRIETSNSFPHSSGIASSASGMSALALCLMSMERSFIADDMTEEFFRQKASFLARLGSGSACRSIEGPLIVWGEHKQIERSSDLFGTKYPYKVHEVFHEYKDTILLVDKGEKQVSSTLGHRLMHDHPFATPRFDQARDHLRRMISVLETGELEGFMEIVEREALSLHAMMLTSKPYFILMKPNTLEIINRVWQFRKETEIPLCFTLDAGANVHLLFPKREKETVSSFIETELKHFCKNSEYINDHTGRGAVLI